MSDTGLFYVVGDNKFTVVWAGKDDPDVQHAAQLHQQACASVLNLLAIQRKEDKALLDLASFLLDKLQTRFVELACTMVRHQKLEATSLSHVFYESAAKRLPSFSYEFGLISNLAAESAALQDQYTQVLDGLKKPDKSKL